MTRKITLTIHETNNRRCKTYINGVALYLCPEILTKAITAERAKKRNFGTVDLAEVTTTILAENIRAK